MRDFGDGTISLKMPTRVRHTVAITNTNASLITASWLSVFCCSLFVGDTCLPEHASQAGPGRRRRRRDADAGTESPGARPETASSVDTGHKLGLSSLSISPTWAPRAQIDYSAEEEALRTKGNNHLEKELGTTYLRPIVERQPETDRMDILGSPQYCHDSHDIPRALLKL